MNVAEFIFVPDYKVYDLEHESSNDIRGWTPSLVRSDYMRNVIFSQYSHMFNPKIMANSEMQSELTKLSMYLTLELPITTL